MWINLSIIPPKIEEVKNVLVFLRFKLMEMVGRVRGQR